MKMWDFRNILVAYWNHSVHANQKCEYVITSNEIISWNKNGCSQLVEFASQISEVCAVFFHFLNGPTDKVDLAICVYKWYYLLKKMYFSDGFDALRGWKYFKCCILPRVQHFQPNECLWIFLTACGE